jgi:hypothetical protein
MLRKWAAKKENLYEQVHGLKDRLAKSKLYLQTPYYMKKE